MPWQTCHGKLLKTLSVSTESPDLLCFVDLRKVAAGRGHGARHSAGAGLR